MEAFYDILVEIVARVALLLLCLFLMTRLKGVKEILQKNQYSRVDYVIIALVFSLFTIIENLTGLNVDGSIVNIRIVTIMASGILFGPFVGITTGLVSGLHRFLIDINGITSIPCLMSSVIAGFVSGAINKKINKKYMWVVGIGCGILCESLTMLLILFMTNPYKIGMEIVSKIALPMILGQFSIGIIVILIQSIEKEREELFRLVQLKEMATKAELKALQSQINPHFLFNSLNAITSFIRIDPDKARELIINLSSYLRYNLESNDEFIDINKELKQVDDYVKIEKARFGNKLNIVYDIDNVEVTIPSLIIQPLVENSIVHGILKSKGKGTVKLSVKDKGDKVQIIVEDNGSGIDEKIINDIYEERNCIHKIGLRNVYSRIKLIYGEKLIIKRLEVGTKVEFYIRK